MIRLPKPDHTRSEDAEVGTHTETDDQEERGEEMRPVKQAKLHAVVDAGRSKAAVVFLGLVNFVFPIVYHGPFDFLFFLFQSSIHFIEKTRDRISRRWGEMEQLALH